MRWAQEDGRGGGDEDGDGDPEDADHKRDPFGNGSSDDTRGFGVWFGGGWWDWAGGWNVIMQEAVTRRGGDF